MKGDTVEVDAKGKDWRLTALILLGAVCLFSGLFAVKAPTAGAVVSWQHGFSVPLVGGMEEAWAKRMTAQAGSTTMRFRLSWDAFQTGVNQYNYQKLDEVTADVQAARGWSPNPFNPKALLEFELPNFVPSWMPAGYQMTAGAGQGTARYYPASIEGAKAYGRAMAKVLKYLSSVNIAVYIETPNEPNLLNGPAQGIPPEYVGRMGGYGLAYAAAEGVPITSPGGPQVLIGSVSTNPDTSKAVEGKTPAQYFRDVQTSANYHIEQFYWGAPNGKEHAAWLMGFWRASFHSYPRLGDGEPAPCTLQWINGKGWRLQDELGNVTGYNAYAEVQNRLIPVLNVLNEVPAKKNWWVTETGMSSYKIPADSLEGQTQCLNRRNNGGSAYGKEQQKKFYEYFAFYQDWQKANSGYPWSGFEGVTFFAPTDIAWSYGDPFKGFGAFYWSSSQGTWLWKPAAVYFADNL